VTVESQKNSSSLAANTQLRTVNRTFISARFRSGMLPDSI
jgi:hypothetical protein